MSVTVLVLGAGIFTLCLLGHVLLWRLRRPLRHAPLLFAIFFGGGFLLSVLTGMFFSTLSAVEGWAVLLLHTAMSGAYILLYPAIQADSPSVKMLTSLEKAMPWGMTEEEMRAVLDPATLFHDRVDDLVLSGLIEERDGQLSLTGRGRALIVPFIYFRSWLGIPAGKG